MQRELFLPYLVEKYAQQLLFHGLSAFRNCSPAYVLHCKTYRILQDVSDTVACYAHVPTAHAATNPNTLTVRLRITLSRTMYHRYPSIATTGPLHK